MDSTPEVKSIRLLEMYSHLVNGEILRKADLAEKYHISPRSVQRDVESLRFFFAEELLHQDIVFDVDNKGYRLVNTTDNHLSDSEIYAICKILLESRSLRRDEMMPVLEKLINCAVPASHQKDIQRLISNEKYHYMPPHHGQYLLEITWTISKAVQQHRVIEIEYERLKDKRTVMRQLWPVGVMFSEYYFYLTGFLEDKSNFENPDDLFPTIYRIDRIKSLRVLDEHFSIPYSSRFEEGEFRKRVQFMYGGKLQKIRFRYTGLSVDSILDKLPTAKIVEQDSSGWIIEAEVFGKGIDMWLRSQGDAVEVLRRT